VEPCPSSEELRHWLAEQLKSPEGERIEAHLESCAPCQHTLEHLTGSIEFRTDKTPAVGTYGRALSHSPMPATLNADSDEDFLRRLEREVPQRVWLPSKPPCNGAAIGIGVENGFSSAESEEGPAVVGYEILGQLGRGGMGVVYKVRQRNPNRVVALKMVLAGVHAAPEELARFRTEIEAVARLQHPHIVQIYEVGQHEGRPYYSMEFADGGSLAQKLNGTPVPSRQAAQLLELLARAVDSAHQRGIVHRDLTPGNVLLTADGTPKITDFGLAKLIQCGPLNTEGKTQAPPSLVNPGTQTGAVLGTPSYMPPEQAAGRTKEIGPATDVYALGAILYEMLTGRPPFRGNSPLETLQQVVSEEPVLPSRLQPKLPRDLETICLKCLEKETHKRYAGTLALADDLARFLVGEPIRARSITQAQRLYRWCSRNPKLAAMSALLAGLLLFMVGGAAVAALRLRAERDTAIANLGRSYLEQARSGRLSGLGGRGYQGLDLIAQVIALRGIEKLTTAEKLELRNEAIACLAAPDLRLVTQQDSGVEYSQGGSAFDSSLERYSYIDPRDQHLVIRRMADNDVLARLPPPPGVSFWWAKTLFSPNGRFLAVSYGTNQGTHPCRVWDLANGKLVFQLDATQDAFDFSPDSRLVAVVRGAGSIGRYELPEGKGFVEMGYGLAGAVGLRFDPAGRQLAYSQKNALHVLDAESGRELAAFPHEDGGTAEWSADGRSLAVGCEDRGIYVYDARMGRLQSVLKGHEAQVLDVAFSPAGNLLASSSWDSTMRLWDPVSGKQWLSMRGYPLRFSADGRRFGFNVGTTFGVCAICDGSVCRRLYHGRAGNQGRWLNDTGPFSVDFSRDGELLASAGGDGIRLWDTARALEKAHLESGQSGSVLFDPQDNGFIGYSQAGLLHWPVQVPDPGNPGVVRIGRPRTLYPLFRSSSWLRAAWDRQGNRLAFTDKPHHHAFVLGAELGSKRIELPDRRDLTSIALSPDGRWAAAPAWQDPHLKVWEADGGATATVLASEAPNDTVCSAAFSRDNRWLVMGSRKNYQWWRVGSWERGPRISRGQLDEGGFAPLAFAANGPLLAIASGAQTLRLVDPSSGQELATLTAPDPHIITCLCFSPDGTQLAAATQDNIIHLWDLRTLRQELATRQLDWDLPPYPPPKEGPALLMQVEVNADAAAALTAVGDPARLRFQVGLSSFVLAWNPLNVESVLERAEAYVRLGELQKASADYSLALALLPRENLQRIVQLAAAGCQPRDYAHERIGLEKAWRQDPDNATTCNNFAWHYVSGPPSVRAPDKALPLALKAQALQPGPVHRNTLGVVYYRLDRFQEAADCFEQDLKESQRYAGWDLFFLAMSNYRLNQADKARDCYDRARHWLAEQTGLTVEQLEELEGFQAEAEGLLNQNKEDGTSPHGGFPARN
jgi:serine/threonine protein kinase/WD40 repeat protein/Tfp pilus assembly protein PilF